MAAKLIAATSITLDGVMQAPMLPDEDSSGGFTRGGWMAAFTDEAFEAEMAKAFAGADAMLMGHRTYDILASFWPEQPDEAGAEQLNAMKKYVATRSSFAASWNNSELLIGDAAETVAALKQRTDETIVIQGSSQLLATLQRDGLVDEYRLFVFPLVLGRGKRVFGDAPVDVRLESSTTTPSGIVCSVYATSRTQPS